MDEWNDGLWTMGERAVQVRVRNGHKSPNGNLLDWMKLVKTEIILLIAPPLPTTAVTHDMI